MPKFNLQYEYSLFLSRMGLKEEKMIPLQKEQLKQAFFSGMGSMFRLITDEVSAIENEGKEFETLEYLMEQLDEYWESQNKD